MCRLGLLFLLVGLMGDVRRRETLSFSLPGRQWALVLFPCKHIFLCSYMPHWLWASSPSTFSFSPHSQCFSFSCIFIWSHLLVAVTLHFLCFFIFLYLFLSCKLPLLCILHSVFHSSFSLSPSLLRRSLLWTLSLLLFYFGHNMTQLYVCMCLHTTNTHTFVRVCVHFYIFFSVCACRSKLFFYTGCPDFYWKNCLNVLNCKCLLLSYLFRPQ